jgi:hypothetical protein
MDRISKVEISQTFDRVIVINLARRPDRLAHFRSRLVDWPFKQPLRFDAVDGTGVVPPVTWDKGRGAWGCLLSHRQVLQDAIGDGVRSLLVLEDDAYPAESFSRRAADFVSNLPEDWDGLMFGAQHLTPPRVVSPGMVRCNLANRAHAYAVRGQFMVTLSQFWQNNTIDHCDIVLASLMPRFKVYSPDPLLIGQDTGVSDISGQREQLRFWPANRPVVQVNVPLRDSSPAVIRSPGLRRRPRAGAPRRIVADPLQGTGQGLF